MFKEAGPSAAMVVPVLGSVPLTLMYSAHLRDKGLRGQPLGPVQRMVANHPLLSSMAVAGGVRGVLSSPVVRQSVRSAGESMAKI
jgi:hypothetical protein